MASKSRALAVAGFWIISVAGLLALLYQRALHNLLHINFANSNFVFFWLAGRMLLLGENPYHSAIWLANHDLFGITWRPNQIFPYPLPLAAFLAPLGTLSLPSAYFTWQILSGVLMLACIWMLLRTLGQARILVLFLPLGLFTMYFGPALLTLQIGALGAFTLAALVGGILSFQHRHSFLAGCFLALTMLKPPQGTPILLLAGAWLYARRDWKAIGGAISGSLMLLAAGMLIDPAWPMKFLGAGRAVLDRTLGMQSNVLGLAYSVCQGSPSCMWAGGIGVGALILAMGSVFLWRHANELGSWEVLSLIVPLAFVSTVYLWSYDQVLYIIPVVWLASQLTLRTRSYIPTVALLLVLTVASLGALLVQANTGKDLLSLVNTLLVLGAYAGFGFGTRRIAPEMPPAP